MCVCIYIYSRIWEFRRCALLSVIKSDMTSFSLTLNDVVESEVWEIINLTYYVVVLLKIDTEKQLSNQVSIELVIIFLSTISKTINHPIFISSNKETAQLWYFISLVFFGWVCRLLPLVMSHRQSSMTIWVPWRRIHPKRQWPHRQVRPGIRSFRRHRRIIIYSLNHVRWISGWNSVRSNQTFDWQQLRNGDYEHAWDVYFPYAVFQSKFLV